MHTKLGILGGGQLGQMLIGSCIDLGLNPSFLDPNPQCSVAPFSSQLTVGDFSDYQTVMDFAQDLEAVTIEIEAVNIQALKDLEKLGKTVFPRAKTLEIIQDKGTQKQFFADHKIPTSPFQLVENKFELEKILKNSGESFPVVQKIRAGGYDGQGVKILESVKELDQAFDAPCVLEDAVDIAQEIGVIVARSASGKVRSFPPVEMVFDPELNLVKYVSCPANVNLQQENELKTIAENLADRLDLIGVLAVEFFINKQGEILVNELAPRVHNSGHLTIEGTNLSQFEMHLRAGLNLGLPTLTLKQPSVMINLIGEPQHQGLAFLEGAEKLFPQPNAHLHWYGKPETRPGRKMGHITIIDSELVQAQKIAEELLDEIAVVAE